MFLCDVNILVYAHREDAPEHDRYRRWLEGVLNGNESYGVSELVLSGFLRIVTHPKVFAVPSPFKAALQFAEQVRSQPHCVLVMPGPRHWEIFTRFCRQTGASGNRVPDAYLAALALESGCEWVTSDRGFDRYEGLRWRHPLA